MPAQIKVGGVWKTVTAIQLRVGGVWKTLTKGEIKVGGVWKTFHEPGGGGGGGITITAPALVYGSAEGFAGAGYVTAGPPAPLITVSGGTAPYTYSWSRVSAPDPYSGGFNITSSASLNPGWNATVNSNDEHVEVWRLTVTDALSASATKDVPVELFWGDLR